ncbi:MAG: thioredoxin fold domain-containing protein [Pseudomonadota bacterium]|nr:thioredoxin fold domain-containing protein [Pseudomonadota bacterium]
MSLRILLTAALASVFLTACDPAESAQASQGVEDTVANNVTRALNGAETASVRGVADNGLYEVVMENGEIFYTTPDGNFLVAGTLYRLNDLGITNLTEQRVNEMSRNALKHLDLSEAITFKAENEKAEIFAFTDITCGYCRVMHQEINQYNKLGITVHYLAFPRHGLEHESANTMQSIWCADDTLQALTDGKMGRKVPSKTCDNPVAQQMLLGVQMGVKGTPAVFTTDGQQLGGYIPPKELATQLGID